LAASGLDIEALDIEDLGGVPGAVDSAAPAD